jgi:hypothetical protein
MHPDQETLEKWIEDYNAAPLAEVEVRFWESASLGGSKDLLGHLEHTPGERNQWLCANCWAWAGTGIIEIALDVQEGIKDRLSIQYLNSNYNGGSGSGWACCGGDLSGFANFYDDVGIAIPWSNPNASWQDGFRQCGDATSVPADTISTTPHYSISDIDDVTIPTQTVSQATAIANIKSILDQNKAVWFAFLLPDNSAWRDFFDFWDLEDEAAVYEIDKFNGDTYDWSEGGGHAVLCVGYNDQDPNNSYWVMLNSWGTTYGRPSGLFQINMDMAYDSCYPHPYLPGVCYDSFYWETLDVSFVPTTIVAPTVTTTATTFVGETAATVNGVIDHDGGQACRYRFGYSLTSGGPYTYTTWSMDVKFSDQSFGKTISGLARGTKYYFIAQAENSEGIGSGFELGFLTKPGAPSSFVAAAGTTQINLLWIKGEGAQKTKIQRTEGGYPTYKDDGTQVYFGEGTSTSDTGLTPGTTYYYRAWSYVEGSEQWSDSYAQTLGTTGTGPNNPPHLPGNPSPVNYATGVPIDVDLSWTGGDPDAGDAVTYDVYFGASSTPPLVSNDQLGTTYDPGTLAYNTKYCWKTVATDNHGASTDGPVWDFTTEFCKPEPDFVAAPREGTAPLQVTFDIAGYYCGIPPYVKAEWDFDNDSIIDEKVEGSWATPADMPPVTYTYTSKGTYTVCVSIYDSSLPEIVYAECKHDYISVRGAEPTEDEPTPELGFASLIAEGKLVIVYNFDPFTTVPAAVNGWTWYDPTLLPGQNNLVKLSKYTAYWVKVTEECWLAYGTQTYRLAAGWNNPVWLGC